MSGLASQLEGYPIRRVGAGDTVKDTRWAESCAQKGHEPASKMRA